MLHVCTRMSCFNCEICRSLTLMQSSSSSNSPKSCSYYTDFLYTFTSTLNGLGVKSKRFIPANTCVIEYKGELISMDKAQQRESEYSNQIPDPGCYMFYCQSGSNKVWYIYTQSYNCLSDFICVISCVSFCLYVILISIDATMPLNEYGLGRYINHSKTNCNLKGQLIWDENHTLRLYFYSKHDISADTELTINYGDNRRSVVAANQWLKQ
jgi:SET domain-containing protein